MQLGVLEFLTFAGTTGIITALLTTGLGWLAEAAKSRRSADHLALQLAVALEAFFLECGERAARLDLGRMSSGAAGTKAEDIPAAPVLPSDENGWRALEKELRNRAMSFVNEVASAKQFVSFMEEAAPERSGDDRRRDTLRQILHLALEAQDLAADLRRTYRWKAPELASSGREWMEKELGRLEGDLPGSQTQERLGHVELG